MKKKIIKRIGFVFALLSLCTLFFVAVLLLGGRDATVLMYHSVGDPLRDASKLSVSEETFEKQMRFLHQHHYNVISLEELVLLMRGHKVIPPKTVVITLDDGYENNYTVVFPILQKYGLPATMFLIVDNLGKTKEIYGSRMRFMTPEEARRLASSDLVTIGSHTLTHAYLPKIDSDLDLFQEIAGSKKKLEAIIGKPVIVFCYPSGGMTARVREIVKGAGYKAAVTILSEDRFRKDDVFAIRRLKVTEKHRNPFLFFIRVSGYYVRMKEMEHAGQR